MSNPARGTKRVCPGCGARFYDLGRSPITCAVCQAPYQVSPPPSSRRAERAQPEPPPKPEVVVEEPAPPVVSGAEVISLDEAEQAEEAAVEGEDIDLGDEADIPDSTEDENTFLEQDEDGNEDVSDIVGDKPKEES